MSGKQTVLTASILVIFLLLLTSWAAEETQQVREYSLDSIDFSRIIPNPNGTRNGTHWWQCTRYQCPHLGLDWMVSMGTPLKAPVSCTIDYAGVYKGYGTTVFCRTILPDGIPVWFVYGHVSKTPNHEGSLIQEGEVVAYSGNTGVGSGPHVHFEVRRGMYPLQNGYFTKASEDVYFHNPENPKQFKIRGQK